MLKKVNTQMLVDTFAMQVYLPADYAGSGYRALSYYSVLGSRVKYFAVGNMRFFKNQKELDDPESVPCHQLALPTLILSEPTSIDIEEIKLSKGGRPRKCIILTYMRDDLFIVNTECIVNSDITMMLLSRLEMGKLDHLSPEVVVSATRDCERINKINLRIPSEELEIFIAERYRDPAHPSRAYRYHTGAVDPDDMVSRSMRVDAMQSTTYQGLTHEDVNSALITASNRKMSGVIDDIMPMEAIVRGLDMEDLKKSDYPDPDTGLMPGIDQEEG